MYYKSFGTSLEVLHSSVIQVVVEGAVRLLELLLCLFSSSGELCVARRESHSPRKLPSHSKAREDGLLKALSLDSHHKVKRDLDIQ